jgi:hypothetical protein
MGTFSVGAMGKLSFTFDNDWGNIGKGFSLGVGIETSRTELHFRKEDVERDWYPTKFAYIAYSTFNDEEPVGIQVDYFGKVGLGSHSVMRIEVGLRMSYYLFL